MNENQKTLLNLILSFLLGIFLTLSITTPIIVSGFRRTDSQSQQLADRLAESDKQLNLARTEIADYRTGIQQCRDSAGRITEIAARGDCTLSGVIQSLIQIRDEVAVLEERLYHLDHDSGNNDSDNSVSVLQSK